MPFVNNRYLLELRLEQGHTQQVVAETLGIAVRTLQRYESSPVRVMERRNDQWEILRLLALHYKVESVQALLMDGLQEGPYPGNVPPHPPAGGEIYVHRVREERTAWRRLLQGDPVAIQGPSLFGKSCLVRYLVEECQERRAMQVTHIRFSREEPAAFESLDSLLANIGRYLLQNAGVPDVEEALSSVWKGPADEKTRFKQLLRKYILAGPETLLLVLEDVDRIHGRAYQYDFFALLRYLAEAKGRRDLVLSKMLILVSISTEPQILESNDRSAFFLMAGLISLRPFSREQIQELIALHGLEASETTQEELVGLLGGHPQLCASAVSEAALRETPLSEILRNREVFAPHLKRQLAWLKDRQLTSAVQRILLDPRTGLNEEVHGLLYSRGLIEGTHETGFRMRCRLYEEFFQRKCQDQGRGRHP